MGLGPAGYGPGDVPLEEARQEAGDARKLARTGADPIEARQAAQRASSAALTRDRENTFEAVAERFLTMHLARLLSAKHREQWRSTLKRYAYPSLGERPIAGITRMEVADVLRPIWNTRQATARRLRQRMERIFRYAKAGGLCTGDNPASLRDGLADLLTAGPIEERHHPALPYQRAGAFMAALAQRESTSARALAFVILTAVRTNEVLGATWREVDIEAREWTIPSERMKKVAGRSVGNIGCRCPTRPWRSW
jgi:integrase